MFTQMGNCALACIYTLKQHPHPHPTSTQLIRWSNQINQVMKHKHACKARISKVIKFFIKNWHDTVYVQMSVSTCLEKWFLCSCSCLYYYTDHYTDSHSSHRSNSEAGVWLQAQKCSSPGYQSLHCFHCQSCGHWRCRLPAAAAVAAQPGQRWPGRRPAQWQVIVVPSLGSESLWTVRTLPQSLQRHLTILNNWPSDTLRVLNNWKSNTNLFWCQDKLTKQHQPPLVPG